MAPNHDRRENEYCNLQCDKECKDHRANMMKMQGMSKLLWLLLVAVLGSGLWQSASQANHDEKDEAYYAKTEINSQFIREQRVMNTKLLESLNNIEKTVIRLEGKVDHHLGGDR